MNIISAFLIVISFSINSLMAAPSDSIRNKIIKTVSHLGKIDASKEYLDGIWYQTVQYINEYKDGKLPQELRSSDRYLKLPAPERKRLETQYSALKDLVKLREKLLLPAQTEDLGLLKDTRKKHSELIKGIVNGVHRHEIEIPYSGIDHLLGIKYDEVEQSIEISRYQKVPEAYIHGPRTWSQSSYELLKRIFEKADLKPGQVFYDLGSGFGRVLLYGAIVHPKVHFRGVEIVKERAFESKRVADDLKLENVKIEAASVLDVNLSEGSVFYFFNPFPSIMDEVMGKLEVLAKRKQICVIALGGSYLTVAKLQWLMIKEDIPSPVGSAIFCSKEIVPAPVKK